MYFMLYVEIVGGMSSSGYGLDFESSSDSEISVYRKTSSFTCSIQVMKFSSFPEK